METQIAEKLITLNRQFYQKFAGEFSATRGRVQPGVLQVLQSIDPDTRILDLGCGNGSVWHALVQAGHIGFYTGLDFSIGLLEAAKEHNPSPKHGRFLQRDLTDPNWHRNLKPNFDLILAFAFLHHLPGKTLRQEICKRVRALLTRGGRFIHSNWQFLNSPRWVERIQPWENAGLVDEDVDPADYLLDWRLGGTGYRYVHHFSETELADLARQTGFDILESFLSDGKEGNLGLYQTWTTIQTHSQ